MKKLLLSASAVLLTAVPVLAQGGPMMGHGGDHAGFFGMRSPVTNAPYSATFTSTSTEKLQDGTVLTHTTTRTVERDSLGRTREEITVPARAADGKPHTSVVIMDPVTRTVTQLRADQKVAIVRTLPQSPDGGFGHRGPGERPANDQQQPRHPENKNVVKTDLGSKTISGVLATGTRVTRTIPANEMGNSTPIISTHEDWFSPDLKIELSRSDVDPFHGTHTITVSSLSKAEPDATLFAVPTGYTVQQAPQHDFGRRGPDGRHTPADAPPPAPGM